jgi:hypothetical protein
MALAELQFALAAAV